MATISLQTPPEKSPYQVYQRLPSIVQRHVIDIGEATTLKGSALAAADIIKTLNIPANTIVLGGFVRVVTPCTSGCTISVGDTASAAGYVAAGTSASAAAGTVYGFNGPTMQSGTTPFAITGGKYYTTADTLNITLAGTAPTVGQLEVILTSYSTNN